MDMSFCRHVVDDQGSSVFGVCHSAISDGGVGAGFSGQAPCGACT